MLFLLYCIIIALNVICLLFNRRSKIIQFISFVFLLILMAGNTYNNDYWAYFTEYINGNDIYFEKEYGLRFIFGIGNLFGLSYQTFLFVVFACCLITHCYIARRMNVNLHIYLCAYLIFGFITDTVVLRNFIALTLLSVALYMMYQKKKIKSILFMALAFLFHKTMLFYVPLLFINFKSLNIKKLIKFGATIIIGLCTVAFMFGSRFEFVGEFISTHVLGVESNAYLSTTTNYGFLIYFAVQLISTLSIYIASKLIDNGSINEVERNDVRGFLDFTFILNLYVIISFPLLMMSVAMYRLFRNIFVLNLIALGSVAGSYKNKTITSKYGKLMLVVFTFCLVWRVLYFFELPMGFSQIIENNILFK